MNLESTCWRHSPPCTRCTLKVFKVRYRAFLLGGWEEFRCKQPLAIGVSALGGFVCVCALFGKQMPCRFIDLWPYRPGVLEYAQ